MIRSVDTEESLRSGGTPFADRYRTLVLMLRDPRTLTRCTLTGDSLVRPIFRRRHAPNKDFGPDWRTLFFFVIFFSLPLTLSLSLFLLGYAFAFLLRRSDLIGNRDGQFLE